MAVLLSVSSPLVLTSISWAKTATEAEIATLVEKVKTTENESEFVEAVVALEKIGQPAIPALIQLLKENKLAVRWGAADALEHMGEPAIPALRAALKDPDKNVRINAVSALQGISIRERDREGETLAALVVPELIVALQDPEPEVRHSA
ncbi:MAG TPA: HEAT repeat domain-containing protein, partial [Stenomitos sp.]